MSLLHDHDHGEECMYSFSVPINVGHHEPDCPSYFAHPHMHCDCDDDDEESGDDGSSVLSDCECENCELKAANRIMRLHSNQTGKGNGQTKKQFEALQISIKKFIDEESKKQANQNSAMDQVARQESNVKLLEAKLKSQELELCILRLNAKEITFNSQMIKNAMRLSSAGFPHRPTTESMKKNEQDTRTVNV
ncbi:uncharacterized protein FA14DRAFT_44265 [Meira miltonrushii]|uniref:Uncharacterized protein n=1 Tax=Meira miltonrushii TaxID=1280837 RepID=A0A316VDD7_9BASI|nr:uncharacterized protein FA14DRAFT_44265 [Meira miltonrushii]PWN35582.1 hypothetical protein FA14DRAFT_44265 [Meira miltonrushii]